jgi:hypothetical protein
VCGLLLDSVSALLAIALPALAETAGSGGDSCPAHLFVIERSKNASIIASSPHRTGGPLSSRLPWHF